MVVRACKMKIVQGLKQFLTELGDGGQSEIGAKKGDHLEEEPLDYKPSPLKKKDEKKSHHQDDDVYSLSKLSPPWLSLHKV